MELLFESRSNLRDFNGIIHTVQWKPEIHPEPLIRPDTFVDGCRVIGYGTVLKEAGRLRMWYQATPKDYVAGDIAGVGYAESDDGYHWHKRPLGIVAHGPGDNHLCDLALHSPSVFVDPDAPATHRYRATGCGRDGFLARPGLRAGYYTAHSADGLRWDLDSDTPQWEGTDVLTSIWHPGRHCGVVALKQMPWVGRMYRRCIHTAEYRDGEFGPHVSALYPDEYDDIAAGQRGYATGDYYGMSMMPTGQSTVGFIWNFWHDSLGHQESWWLTGNKGSSSITLAWQDRPGGRWLHVPGRPDFISHRDLPWMNEGWVNALSAPVEMGDEHWLYFGGRNYEHLALRGRDGKPREKWVEWIKEHGITGIGVARWPKYRLIGLEAPSEATLDIELENLTQPFELRINYKARGNGRVRASIANDPRHAAEDFLDLCGDALAAPLTWKTGSSIAPPPGGKLRVTIHLEMAAIYAYETIPL